MFGFSSSTAEASSSTASSGANGSKWKDDVELVKMLLSDQGFASGRYPDPLMPRGAAGPTAWPKDVTPELEARWLGTIRASP